MGYADGTLTQPVIAAADLSATGDKATWNPSGLPATLRRLAVVVTTAVTTPAAVVSLDLRPTAGSNTGRVPGGVGTLTIPSASPQGRVIYKDLNTTLLPGQEVVVNVTTAAGAGVVDMRLNLVPGTDTPANNARMVASA